MRPKAASSPPREPVPSVLPVRISRRIPPPLRGLDSGFRPQSDCNLIYCVYIRYHWAIITAPVAKKIEVEACGLNVKKGSVVIQVSVQD